MTDIPKELDWVRVRSGCSLALVFDALREQVQKDVEIRNELMGRHQPRCSVQSWNQDFAVLYGDGGGTRSVVFFLGKNSIQIKGGSMTLLFEATLTLNDAGECKLMVDGKELELWQVRKRALENLFFGDVLGS